MRWERRRPVWPLMGGLACLFGLAVAAPYCWQHPVLNVHELIERRQSLRPVETQPLPVRTNFNFDTLRQMHSALKKMVDAQATRPAPTISSPPKPVVMVTSPSDRLAMLDTRTMHQAAKLIERARPYVAQFVAQRPAIANQPVIAVAPTPLLRQSPGLLIDRLEKLARHPLATDWAVAVLGRVKQLTDSSQTSPAIGLQIIAELKQLAAAGHIRSLEISDPAIQQNWLQAAEGLERRLGVWQLLIERGSVQPITPTAERSAFLMPVLTSVADLLAGNQNGQEWRDYLLLDQVAAVSSEGADCDQATRMRLAQEVLSRLGDPRLTAEQKEFIAGEPIDGLAQELRTWAAGPVDLERLLTILERYEADGQMIYSSALAQLTQRMTWSDDARLQTVAGELQRHFRGANMRVALSGDMFNRMIPPQQSVVAPVRERIAGTKVEGRSRTTTDVGIELVPTDDAWRIALQAEGHVFSQTRSDTWPVRVRNAARYEYEAEKVITIGQNGLEVAPTVAQAHGRHQFLGADSNFDGVPFMGAMFRNLAKKETQKTRHTAVVQVKSKVEKKARTRMDHEADPKLAKLEQRFHDYVLMPFGQLALAAEPVDMFTTSDRAVMQLRMANLDQLAAHTPRPSAPADSVVSVQLHETALNNAFAGLDLEGRRMMLPELHAFLADKFGFKDASLPDDFPTRARIEFARHDAVHVSFADDRLALVLNIRELGHGRDKIQNFQVHAYYRPQLDGLAVQLVRDETLQFSGRNLKTGPRVVLHSVMGKVFSRGRELPMVKKTLEADPRFAGLMVTQLVIDDGWMALALGPTTADRTAWRTPNYVLETELK
jgi:hypothetical protein